ncbi:MAG: EAL domain-containing protein, partial [Gammaproteobacteria bacterium]|nr:EAL domain-containing protein [Gammaproteobacteria bacterium]
ERLEQLAHYDQLTGLPNRMLFQDRLHSAVARSKRHDHSIAVMYVDLDGFKQVNDTLGHAAGDNLLIEIGSRLNHCVRDEDTIARLGGDEFAIIINELQDMSYLHALAKRVVNELSTTLSYEGRELHVSGSVGIATFPSDKTDEHNLLRNADQAMYHAKQKGKNTYQFFDPDMNTKMINRIHLESDLRYAIKFDELFVHYQPKYDLQKNKVVGVEALVRWLHPERGLVLPLDFIPVAEDSELIIDLGRQVLEKACQDAQAWYNAGRLSIPVAVNISARQFKYDHFVRDVKYALEMSGLSPDLLEIEITESLLMDDVENTITTLNELKSMGMSISIDDFGTGYSSLNYLKKLPVDTLKIDRSFVMDIADDDDDRAIISAIISMAKSLNLRVIAEGVENEQQLDFLSKNFCHEIQGFLLTEPVSCGELNSLIDSIEAKWDRVDALV